MRKIFFFIASLFLLTNTYAIEPNEDSKHVFKIVVKDHYYPFSYVDDNGNRAGFDVDFANAMCQKLNIKCQIVPQSIAELLQSVKAHKLDILVAGLCVTEERLQYLVFSDPYYECRSLIVGAPGLSDFSTLKKEQYKGLRLGTQKYTMQDNIINKSFVPHGAAHLEYDEYIDIFDAHTCP